MHKIAESGSFFIILLYCCIALVLYLRIQVEATHYISLDSHFYLEVANNLQAGKGIVAGQGYPFEESASKNYFSLWPAGYPILISGLSVATGLSPLIASKVVNLIFLALIFILLYHWFGAMAWFPALAFCSFGMLEVYSYTWSEGPFLFFVLLLCYLLYKHQVNAASWFYLALAFCLIALFLLRYAGLIYYFFVAGYALYVLWQQRYPLFYQCITSLALASVVALSYLAYNYSQTGFFTGGTRYFPERESWAFFITNLAQGIFNEFSIVRNYFFSGYTDYYFLFFLMLQMSLVALLYRRRRYASKTAEVSDNVVGSSAVLENNIPHRSLIDKNSPQFLLISAGVFYLLMIIILRRLSPFATFDYRILAPFSLPLYIALAMHWLQDEGYFKKIVPCVTGFMLLSLLFNLPKEFLLSYILGLW